MNFSDDQIVVIRKKSEKALDAALDCFDSASILARYSKFIHSYSLLRDSLKYLIECYFTVFGIPETEDKSQLIEDLKEVNRRNTWFSDQLENIPGRILEINSDLIDDKLVAQDYEKLLAKYSKLIRQFQHNLNCFKKKELVTKEERALKKRKIALVLKIAFPSIIIAVLLFIGTLYAIYLKSLPSQHFLGLGQLFWTGADVTNFSEAHSKTFKVEGDGKFGEYTISLPRTAKMEIFRFDPINLKVKEIEVDSIQLVDGKGGILLKFEFSADDPQWDIINCKALNSPDGTWKLRAKNHDPIIISPQFNEIEVKLVKIRLRLFGTPFKEWLFG